MSCFGCAGSKETLSWWTTTKTAVGQGPRAGSRGCMPHLGIQARRRSATPRYQRCGHSHSAASTAKLLAKVRGGRSGRKTINRRKPPRGSARYIFAANGRTLQIRGSFERTSLRWQTHFQPTSSSPQCLERPDARPPFPRPDTPVTPRVLAAPPKHFERLTPANRNRPGAVVLSLWLPPSPFPPLLVSPPRLSSTPLHPRPNAPSSHRPLPLARRQTKLFKYA